MKSSRTYIVCFSWNFVNKVITFSNEFDTVIILQVLLWGIILSVDICQATCDVGTDSGASLVENKFLLQCIWRTTTWFKHMATKFHVINIIPQIIKVTSMNVWMVTHLLTNILEIEQSLYSSVKEKKNKVKMENANNDSYWPVCLTKWEEGAWGILRFFLRKHITIHLWINCQFWLAIIWDKITLFNIETGARGLC